MDESNEQLTDEAQAVLANDRIKTIENTSLQRLLLFEYFLREDFLNNGPILENCKSHENNVANYEHFLSSLNSEDLEILRNRIKSSFGGDYPLISNISDPEIKENIEVLIRLFI